MLHRAEEVPPGVLTDQKGGRASAVHSSFSYSKAIGLAGP